MRQTVIILSYCFLILCFPSLTMAQKKAASCVMDAETNLPIGLVTIISSVDYSITNSEGEFSLKVQDNDVIKLSHISYHPKQISHQQLKDTIFLEPKIIQLAEVLVMPKNIIAKELTAVWKRYDNLFSENYTRSFPYRTYYYRQLTQNNDLYTEYMECFFTAQTGTSIMEMSLQEGRYAGIKKDSLEKVTNFFYISQVHPFSQLSAKKRNALNCFLVKDFEKYYNIYISRIISPKSDDEVKVYEFVPINEQIGKNATMLAGFLYIRTKDLSIIRMEANTTQLNVTGIPDIRNKKYNFTVTYQDGISIYPVVETVVCELEINHQIGNKENKMRLYSTLFATDYDFKSSGKKMKKTDFLLKKVADSELNQEFWDNNPIIKRTKIEQQVVDDFNKLGYFGSMNIN